MTLPFPTTLDIDVIVIAGSGLLAILLTAILIYALIRRWR